MASLSSSIPPDEAAFADSHTASSAGNTTNQPGQQMSAGEGSNHTEKTGLLGLLKKKMGSNEDESSARLSHESTLKPSDTTIPTTLAQSQSPSATTSTNQAPRSFSPVRQSQVMTPPSNATQYPGSPQSHISAISPSRQVRSSSPHLHSPSSSSIFERNVQEQPLPEDLSAAIPSHIQTEDHIPPILEASSKAITDDQLNPDQVEIVMHSLHQPAATNIAHHENMVGGAALSPLSLGSTSDHPPLSSSAIHDSTTSLDEHASHYGALDNADVRRLSFISFADVVQGEHALESSMSSLPKDLHSSVLSSTTNRSPSPARSYMPSHAPQPGSGELGLSPPTSGASSVKGLDLSGGKSLSTGAYPGSPLSLTATGTGTHSPPPGTSGELTVQTMRQALRKTGSGDLSAARNPVSPTERSHGSLSGHIE